MSLLHEFAIDPESIPSWNKWKFKYFFEQCGLHHGRLISDFAKDGWFTHALKQLEEGVNEINETDFSAIHALIEQAILNQSNSPKVAKGCRDCSSYDSEKTWIENAFIENDSEEEKAFHTIISDKQVDKQPDNFLVAEEIQENTKRWKKLWEIPREIRIPRKADEMAKCVSLLFRLTESDCVLLVDPNFRPSFNYQINDYTSIPKRFVEALKAFVWEAKLWDKKEIQYHVCLKNRTEEDALDDLKPLYKRDLQNIVPPALKLNIIFWKKRYRGKSFHARYVLTKVGGFRFDHGLDIDDRGNGETDVSLLDTKLHEEVWKDFYDGYKNPASAPFELIDYMEIQSGN